MAKPITINKQHTEQELEKEIKHTRDGKYRLRIQVILQAMQKKSSIEIHKNLLVNKDTIFRWVRWYNEKGLQGIKEVSKGGRKEGNPIWDNNIFDALCDKLDLMEEYWSIPKMQSWIEENYGVKIPLSTIHHRLGVNGYSFKSSRPNPYKGDPNLQAAFKKTVS
jgi:transposase